MTAISTPAPSLALPPAVTATAPRPGLSDRYGFVPTGEVLSGLESAGFRLVQASAHGSRRPAYARHVLRLRHESARLTLGEYLPEVVVLNSHDGSSAYRVSVGLFRCVCANGLVVGSPWAELRVRHTKRQVAEVVAASLGLVEAAPKAKRAVEAMQSVVLPPARRLEFAEAALRLRWPNPATRPEALLVPAREEDAGPDLWTNFNVAQERLLSGGLPTRRSRRTRAVRAPAEVVRLNRELWRLAERAARLEKAA